MYTFFEIQKNVKVFIFNFKILTCRARVIYRTHSHQPSPKQSTLVCVCVRVRLPEHHCPIVSLWHQPPVARCCFVRCCPLHAILPCFPTMLLLSLSTAHRLSPVVPIITHCLPLLFLCVDIPLPHPVFFFIDLPGRMRGWSSQRTLIRRDMSDSSLTCSTSHPEHDARTGGPQRQPAC